MTGLFHSGTENGGSDRQLFRDPRPCKVKIKSFGGKIATLHKEISDEAFDSFLFCHRRYSSEHLERSLAKELSDSAHHEELNQLSKASFATAFSSLLSLTAT